MEPKAKTMTTPAGIIPAPMNPAFTLTLEDLKTIADCIRENHWISTRIKALRKAGFYPESNVRVKTGGLGQIIRMKREIRIQVTSAQKNYATVITCKHVPSGIDNVLEL